MKKLAVVGVLDSTGREILSFLEADGFSAKNLVALDHKAPMGTQVSYGEDTDLDVFNLDDYKYEKPSFFSKDNLSNLAGKAKSGLSTAQDGLSAAKSATGSLGIGF